MLESILQAIGRAAGSLGRTPTFTAAVILTLALGIGATTAMFSIVYGVLFRPLPYADSDRLVRLSEWHPGGTPLFGGDDYFSNVTYYAWNGRSHTIGPIAVYSSTAFTVGEDEPTRIAGARLSPAVFTVLGASPTVGRFFNDDDTRPGAMPVVVLSHALWHERFAANPAALGRSLVVDERPHVIVGIAPFGFAFPDREARLWTPTSLASPAAGGVLVADAIARLAPGVTAAQASREGTAIARAQARPPALETLLGKGGPVEVTATRVVDEMTRAVRPALLVLLAGVACLLLIACANVGNLLLSRGASRGREVAVRAALGARRSRLVRQLLTETVVIASIGGSIGGVAALLRLRALPAIGPPDFPRLDAVRLDSTAVLFACVISLATAFIAGAIPAAKGARLDLLPALRDGRGASGSQTTAARHLILGAEASLAVMLLIIALLAGRSFLTLLHVDPGYEAAHVLVARVYLPGAGP